MSNNQNQNFPAYVESDLNKSKIVAPPRIRKKERSIYIYETNQDIITVETTDAALSVQAKLSKITSAQITTPLNFDIAGTKLPSLGDSGVWGGQINGFIYEDIDLDTSKYNFVTLAVAAQDTIKQSVKLRIVSINKIFNEDNNKFLYASIVLVPDTIKTIRSIEKINWQIVNEFQTDIKTKYLKFEFKSNAIIYPNSLKISTITQKGARPRNDGFTVTQAPDLALKLIKIRQTSPLEIDDLSFSNLKDVNPIYSFGSSSNSTSASTTTSADQIRMDSSTVSNGRDTKKLQDPYFDYAWDFLVNFTSTRFGGEKSTAILKQRLIDTKLSEFLAGTYSIDGLLVENTKDLLVTPDLKKISDLDRNDTDDRKYFILSKPQKLDLYLTGSNGQNLSGSSIRVVDQFPKTRLIREDEWPVNPIDDDNIVIDLELKVEGFSPLIKIDTQITDFIKITQYDSNHKIIGTPSLEFGTASLFDDTKKTNSIQL